MPERKDEITCHECGATKPRSQFNTSEQHKADRGGAATCQSCVRKRKSMPSPPSSVEQKWI